MFRAILSFYFSFFFYVFHLYPMLPHCPAVRLQKCLFTECTFNDCIFIFWVNDSFMSTICKQNSTQIISWMLLTGLPCCWGPRRLRPSGGWGRSSASSRSGERADRGTSGPPPCGPGSCSAPWNTHREREVSEYVWFLHLCNISPELNWFQGEKARQTEN